MKHLKNITKFSVLVSIIFFTFTYNTHAAYLDPGSGSFIIQMIIASLVGASFLLKTFWANIKAFFTTRFSNQPQDEKDEA